MADHSLSLSALRVAVYAPRDGEMRALARELAAARGDLRDLSGRFEGMEARYDTLITALHADIALLAQQLGHSIAMSRSPYRTMGGGRFLTWRAYAEQEIAYHEERENHLTRGADRLARGGGARRFG